ncbi:MAG: ribbon-helix-helix domain-containing protein [Deltaproteobacteria bacterium]|nr:ribbon-helix-helix domain-containing protein [Deltaproteobacteria bacterium]
MHTRISEDLDEALQDAARRLRVPVSNLVRNVLEDVFDVVEAVTENVGDFVEDVVEEAQHLGRRWEGRFRERTAEARARRVEVDRDEARAPAPRAAASRSAEREFPDVAAWQPLVMNTAQECAGCGRQMRRGDDAYLAVGGTRPGPLFLCQPCLQDL